jgi:hypothetical protein
MRTDQSESGRDSTGMFEMSFVEDDYKVARTGKREW